MFLRYLRMSYNTCTTRGFSLIELLVTLAISTLVVAAVLIRFDAFDSVVVLKSTAYELALTIREAQVFAVSATGDTTGQFDTAYGVFVDRINAPRSYVFFEDSNDNGVYNSSGDTILETYTMGEQYEIRDICADLNCNRDAVSLVFKRPEFDPTIVSSPAVGNPNQATIQLGIRDNTTDSFTVVVGVTGQVSVITP